MAYKWYCRYIHLVKIVVASELIIQCVEIKIAQAFIGYLISNNQNWLEILRIC